jgi:hypothetical protein
MMTHELVRLKRRIVSAAKLTRERTAINAASAHELYGIGIASCRVTEIEALAKPIFKLLIVFM